MLYRKSSGKGRIKGNVERFRNCGAYSTDIIRVMSKWREVEWRFRNDLLNGEKKKVRRRTVMLDSYILGDLVKVHV